MSLITCDLSLDEPLENDFYAYLMKWMKAPHIRYDNKKLTDYFYEDYLYECSYYGELGRDGEYFVCESKDDFENLKGDEEYHHFFPSMYCPWEIGYDQQTVLFIADAFAVLSSYECMMWLRYIIGHFLEPNGYFLNGSLSFGLSERHGSLSFGPSKRQFYIENNKIIEL